VVVTGATGALAATGDGYIAQYSNSSPLPCAGITKPFTAMETVTNQILKQGKVMAKKDGVQYSITFSVGYSVQPNDPALASYSGSTIVDAAGTADAAAGQIDIPVDLTASSPDGSQIAIHGVQSLILVPTKNAKKFDFFLTSGEGTWSCAA